jgi:hypothetical protein
LERRVAWFLCLLGQRDTTGKGAERMSTSPPGHDPSRHWGTSPPPPEPKRKRRGRILLAAAIGVALLVTTGIVANSSTLDTRTVPTPPTTASPDQADPSATDPAEVFPEEDPEAEPAPEAVEVPTLVGMTLTKAKQALADGGLKATTKYKSTARYPAGTVISQSHQAGAGVLPNTTISLVVAKTPPPPPPPPTAPAPPATTPAQNCDSSYPDVCLDPTVADYDCAGGSGNGPEYVEGPIRVRPPDPFDLDRDGDGWGCENG